MTKKELEVVRMAVWERAYHLGYRMWFEKYSNEGVTSHAKLTADLCVDDFDAQFNLTKEPSK